MSLASSSLGFYSGKVEERERGDVLGRPGRVGEPVWLYPFSL
jgi:hypothetical protein